MSVCATEPVAMKLLYKLSVEDDQSLPPADNISDIPVTALDSEATPAKLTREGCCRHTLLIIFFSLSLV